MYSQNEAHFFQSHFWNGNQSPFTAEQIVESALALSQLCHEPLKKEDCFDFEAQGSDSIFRHTSPSNNGLGDSGYYSNTSLGEHSFTDCTAWRKSSVPGTTNMTYSRKSTEVYKEEKQTLVEIIARAIMATPTRHATLREIYDFMLQHYESYRQRRQQRSWRNSVRHHLYLYDVFVKTNHKMSHGQHLWTLKPAAMKTFSEGNYCTELLSKKIEKTPHQERNCSIVGPYIAHATSTPRNQRFYPY